MTINGCDTETLTLNDALKLLQTASVDNESSFQLELVRANRSATSIVIEAQHDNAPKRTTSTTTSDSHLEKGQDSRPDCDQLAAIDHVTVESHVTMAAYSVHSLERRRDKHSTSVEKTPSFSTTSSTSALLSPGGQRSTKTFQPVRFDLTNVSGRSNHNLTSSAEISPLLPIKSGSAEQFISKERPNAEYNLAVDNTKKSNYSWKPSSKNSATAVPDRSRRDVTNSAAETVLRGFRSLRNFWLSPKLSRRSIDDDDDEDCESVSKTTPSEVDIPSKPRDVVKLSSMPHVLEQPSPAEEIPLPASVPRFTMDEFTKVFGPCRLAFSLPSSPLRRKRLSTTSTTSSMTETEATMEDAYSETVGDVGSVCSASTTPNMTRRVTFQLDSDRDSSMDRDSVVEEIGSSVWSTPVVTQLPNRGNQPHTARELSRPRVTTQSLRSIRESLPLDSTVSPAPAAVVDKSSINWPPMMITSDSGGNTDDGVKHSTFDGRVVKSSARIKLVSSPVTVGQQQQQQQHQHNNKQNRAKDGYKDVRMSSLNSRANTQNGTKSTLSKNSSNSLPRQLEHSLLSRDPKDLSTSTLPLPTAPDPIITLLSAGRGPVFQHPERSREPSLVSTDGTCTPGRTTPSSEHSDQFRTTSSTAVSEDEDLTYRDWYRKVFSTLHKTNRDLEFDIDDFDANDETVIIPRRPSVTKSNEKSSTPVASTNGLNKTATNTSDSYKCSSLPRDTRIFVKSTKSKSLDGTALTPEIPSTGQTHRAVQKFELEVSAKLAAEKKRKNSLEARQRSTKLIEVSRSMQEPCKIVKPEDKSLYNDEYWLEFAKQLDRERIPPTVQIVNSDETRSSKHPLPGQRLNRQDTNEETRVLKLSEKFIIPPHHYDTTPIVKPPSAVSTTSTSTRSTIGKAKALYTFVAGDDKEMSFCRGDVINLIRQVDKNWYEGRISSRRGLVPSNYIELLAEKEERFELLEDLDKDMRVLALHSFIAKAPEELSINKGDVLTVTRNVDANWYEGWLNGRQGLFPVNHVERLSEADCLSQTTSSVQDQMSSPPSDTDLSYSSLPMSSPFVDRGDVYSQSYRRPEPSRYGVSPGVQPQRTAVNASFRQQPPPSASTVTKYPHKEQLFVAIGSNGDDSCTDGVDELHIRGNDSGVSKNLTSTGSQRRVKFNDERPLTASTRVATSDHRVNSGQRSGVIPPQQEPRSNTSRRVLYDYEPRHDDELALREGDLVTVIRSFDDGWCVGMLNRTKKIGTFPGNYLM